MLNLVFGRSGYGKTEYVFNEIKRLVDKGENNILLFTPEQYSFISERRLLDLLGERNISAVENLSFRRLATLIFNESRENLLPVLSSGGKTILMSQAIEECKDSLKLFNKRLDSLSFVGSMISLYDEMKSCNLTSEQIVELSSGIDNEVLRCKLNDVAAVMKQYQDKIEDRFIDEADVLTVLYGRLINTGYFKGKHIFFDGFNGFVAQEYKIFELIIAEAADVTVTLCRNPLGDEAQFDLFTYVNKTASILEGVAEKAGIPVNINSLYDNHRTDNYELRCIEQNMFSYVKSTAESQGAVTLYSAASINDECAFVSRQIKRLIREGYRASDITVIARDTAKYRDELFAAFRKFEVPFYNDERQPIKTQPLVVFIEYLFRIINYSFRSDDILSLAKTGLVDATDEEINRLECYVYIWSINGLAWTRPFENSPRGIGNEISDEDRKLLEELNKTRESLINPLLKFKEACKSHNAKRICESIYYTLINLKADEKIRERAVKLNSLGLPLLSDELGAVWDIVMELLNQLATTITEDISTRDIARLFSLMVNAEDFGALPSGIDNVQFGQADRIRTDNPSVVFILGANADEFPKKISASGILSEAERRIMLDNKFKLYSYGEILAYQEKYFAYMAASAPSERLYASYVSDGKSLVESQLITDIRASIPNIKIHSSDDYTELDLIESEASAFDLMSERLFDNSSFYSSLRKYFEGDSRYNAIGSILQNKSHRIKTAEAATSLFGYNMYISASKVEDFYCCPYRYFCKFGLRAYPFIKAEINSRQRGLVIHGVLESILRDVGSRALSAMSSVEIKQLVDKYVKKYYIEHMSEVTNLNEKFNYNFNRLASLIYSVAIRLSNEFKSSKFEPRAFELDIDKDASVKPEIITLSDDGTMQIRGQIDRVDTYFTNDRNYVRVVDYKSGGKDFKLSDITAGLNLQMFIYLFSLCSDKNAELTGIPAGVLYMHASGKNVQINNRRNAYDELIANDNKLFKMKGIVLDDENDVLGAMDDSDKGKFVPKGKEDIISSADFELIHREVNSLISQMGDSLHNGYIPQYPVFNANHQFTCDYCDYGDICANSRIIENRVSEDISNSEILNRLREKYSD